VSVLQRVWALMLKELLALLKDPRSRVVVIAPPIIQTLVFGYAATFDLNDLAYAVYDQEHSDASRELLAHFSGSPHFREVEAIGHDSEIAPLVDSRAVLLVVHVQRGFTRDLLDGRPASLQLVVDGRNSNTALVALGYAKQLVNAFGRQWRAEHGGAGPPAEVVVRAWFNPNLESRWFIVPGLVGLLTLLVTMVVTSLSVAREREQGTFDQLLVTPLRPLDILLGKSLPGVMIGFGEATVMIGIVTLWFEVPLRGSLFTLYLGVGVFLLSAVGVGLMISSLAVTLQQGLLGAFLFMVPAILLSGFATPIENMPPWLQTLTLANPLRYFLRVLRGTFLEGAPLSLLWHQLWPLVLIGLATLAAAGWLFRRRLY
jgi:ABC-2 type transport system permease protein